MVYKYLAILMVGVAGMDRYFGHCNTSAKKGEVSFSLLIAMKCCNIVKRGPQSPVAYPHTEVNRGLKVTEAMQPR